MLIFVHEKYVPSKTKNNFKHKFGLFIDLLYSFCRLTKRKMIIILMKVLETGWFLLSSKSDLNLNATHTFIKNFIEDQ